MINKEHRIRKLLQTLRMPGGNTLKSQATSLLELMEIMPFEPPKGIMGPARLGAEWWSDYKPLPKQELLEHVRLTIGAEFPNWVLFSNGTYIIFDDAKPEDDLHEKGIDFMKSYGPAGFGGPQGDTGQIGLRLTPGWLVTGHGYGMYTFVSFKEIKLENLQELFKNWLDYEVQIFGRFKRDRDSQELKIIHVNRAT